MIAPAAVASLPPAPKSGSLALTGWVLFDWATQPFYTLVSTFLFAPYFVNVFIGNPVMGQAAWGYAAAVSGLAIAILSPTLGAIADRRGRLKRWVFAFSIILVVSQALLWFAQPGASGMTMWLILLAIVAGTIAAEVASVFNNALMPSLVRPDQVGRLSGIGWAAGYIGGLIALVIMAGFIVVNPATGKSLLGLDPLMQFDAASREADRLTGPFSALWYVVFIIPFFLFTPDAPARPGGGGMGQSIREGLGELRQTLGNLGQYPNTALFLLARMIYNDGLSTIFIFGGIYAAAIFEWQAFQLGLFGIILTAAGAIGAIIGGFLDDRAGAKPVILGSLILVIIGTAGVLSINRDEALFGLVASRGGDGGAFSSPGEQLYLAFAILIGFAAGPLQASSRSLLARMAPEGKTAEFFGLFAFSGKAMSFAAPFLVATATAVTGSQQIGISIVLAFLAVGFVLMITVNPRKA